MLILTLLVIHSLLLAHSYLGKQRKLRNFFFSFKINFCVWGKYWLPSPVLRLLSNAMNHLEFLMSYSFLFLSSIIEEYKHSQTYHNWGQMDKMVPVKELMADVYNIAAIWAALLFFGNASSLPYVLSHLSHVRLFVTPWTVAYQTPLSMGFSRQEYWSGVPLPPSGLPDPGIEPSSPVSPTLACGFVTTSATWEAQAFPGQVLFIPDRLKCSSSKLLCLSFQGLKDKTLFYVASWAYKMSPFPDI